MFTHRVFTHLQTLCIGKDAYLVGGAARMLLGLETGEPKDWDICLNFKKPWFGKVFRFPSSIVKTGETYFGGDKFVDKTFHKNTILLDVFHREIGEFLRMAPRVEVGIRAL